MPLPLDLPLPVPARWTEADLSAVAWDGQTLQIWNAAGGRILASTCRRQPSDSRALLRRLVGDALPDRTRPLLDALRCVLCSPDPALLLPGAVVQARRDGSDLALALHPDAPPARFLSPDQPRPPPVEALLPNDVPHGQRHLPPCPSRHALLAGADAWCPGRPPPGFPLSWRRIRTGRGIAAAAPDGDHATILGAAILP